MSHDIAEILLKLVLNTNQSRNHSMYHSINFGGLMATYMDLHLPYKTVPHFSIVCEF
jgi:hypothetical protein